MGRAFCMAYAQQLHAAAPLQLGAGALQSRSPATPPLLHSAATVLHDSRTWTNGNRTAAVSTPHGIARPCWAKKLLGKTKHHDPLINQAMELTGRALSSSSTDSSKASSSQPVGNSSVGCSTQNLEFDMWSPAGGCSSSSEDNNSPTDLNSCKQIGEKPSMSKNLEVVQKNSLDNSFGTDFIQLSNAGYISEIASLDSSPTLRISKLNCKVQDETFQKNSLSSQSLTPTAPVEDKLLELSSEYGSKRLSCDQNVSSSEVTNSDTSNCGKSKRISHSGSAWSGSSGSPPPPPERHDSLCNAISEESELRDAPWFQAGIPREIALEVLEQEPVGSFMVRESTSKPGCFALSLRVPRDFHQTGIAHYLIMRTNRGYKIKGFTKEFGTLTALIIHHSVMPELLPCPLSLSRYNPSLKKNESEDMVDIDEDSDYNLMSDFRKLLTDINV